LVLNRKQREAELGKGIFLAALICAPPLFARFAPAWTEHLYPPCIFTMITKIYCPGCGTTRAFKALADFNLSGAFLYNPFLFLIIIPLVLYLCVIYFARAGTGRWIPSVLSSPKAVLPVGAVIVGIWIFRNVFPLGLS
jgi:hypothetical protein